MGKGVWEGLREGERIDGGGECKMVQDLWKLVM